MVGQSRVVRLGWLARSRVLGSMRVAVRLKRWMGRGIQSSVLESSHKDEG